MNNKIKLPFRQVHLDFHTSESIGDIGSCFSKADFAAALMAGHVDSVTVFSKCHHGWSYHPTSAGVMHPGLSFDLLEAQLEVCAELGVRAPVYISAGLDERIARIHPEWILRGASGKQPDFSAAGYHYLCYNTPYLDMLLDQIAEVMQRYNPCEIFLDISSIHSCYCAACLADREKSGKTPEELSESVYMNYCSRVEQTVRRYNADTAIFHNGGHITRGRRELAYVNTHLELESLPTGGWGYDHFPLSAAYARTLGMPFLGMTGKFHTSWGEFGGFKHPNALRYEASLSIACGAKCSVGDQLHPLGMMNPSTYKLIGKAYAEVEKKEPWCGDVEPVADIALLSDNSDSDTGANRILLEGHYLYDIIDRYSVMSGDLARYKLLILPDNVRLSPELAGLLQAYMTGGGKILATGLSGLREDEDEFALDFGAGFAGRCEHVPDYFVPCFDTVNGQTEYIIYAQGYELTPRDGAVCFAMRQSSYFNRTAEHFCSHQHTPNDPRTQRPACVFSGGSGASFSAAYLSWELFGEYTLKGSYHVKELLVYAIDTLLGADKTLTVTLPDRGIVTLMRQPAQRRLVNHLLFAYTTVRGAGTEVIEGTVPPENVVVSLKTEHSPQKVYLAPQNTALPFTNDGHTLSYTVPRVDIHQMIVIEY